MNIVKVHNKARNITYVYESESYWDKELKQPRSHRKLIGRIDPATGEVVPTGRKPKSPDAPCSDTDYKALFEQACAKIEKKDALIQDLRKRILALENDSRSCRNSIRKACEILMNSPAGKDQGNG